LVAALHIQDDLDLVKMIWGKYLQHERKYDALGAQGKILVIKETLAEVGLDINCIKDLEERKRLTNLIFPRTFKLEYERDLSESQIQEISATYHELRQAFSDQGIKGKSLERSVLEETAARFSISVVRLREILDICN
jgi:hypothetical protein